MRYRSLISKSVNVIKFWSLTMNYLIAMYWPKCWTVWVMSTISAWMDSKECSNLKGESWINVLWLVAFIRVSFSILICLWWMGGRQWGRWGSWRSSLESHRKFRSLLWQLFPVAKIKKSAWMRGLTWSSQSLRTDRWFRKRSRIYRRINKRILFEGVYLSDFLNIP